MIRVTYRDGSVEDFTTATNWKRERIDGGNGVYIGDIILTAGSTEVAVIMCDAARSITFPAHPTDDRPTP